MVRNGAFSNKIDFITFLGDSKHQRTTKSATLQNGWIFPIGQSGEASWGRVCYEWGLPRLIFTQQDNIMVTIKKLNMS